MHLTSFIDKAFGVLNLNQPHLYNLAYTSYIKSTFHGLFSTIFKIRLYPGEKRGGGDPSQYPDKPTICFFCLVDHYDLFTCHLLGLEAFNGYKRGDEVKRGKKKKPTFCGVGILQET